MKKDDGYDVLSMILSNWSPENTLKSKGVGGVSVLDGGALL